MRKVLLLAFLLLASTPAYADAIHITSGQISSATFFSTPNPDSIYNISGEGFELTGTPCGCFPIQAATEGHAILSLSRDFMNLNGVTAETLGLLEFVSTPMTFHVPHLLPPGTTITQTGVFSMTGHVEHSGVGYELFGQGVVETTFCNGCFNIMHASYTFSVPEPASVGLLVVGLVGLLAAVGRGRRRQHV